MDLKDVDVEVLDREIIITLPKSQILSLEIDEESLKIFDEKSSIFNQIKVEDMNNFTIDQKKKIEQEVVEKGVLAEADANMKKAITEVLNFDPKIAEDYTITFK